MNQRRQSGSSVGSGGGWRAVRRGVVAAITFVAIAVAVGGLARLGELARSRLGPRDRYAVRFADLICDAPPGYDRAAFLAEVRSLSGWPDTVQALDPELTAGLTAAFTTHPWVETVDGVSVRPDGRISIGLRFRVPMLAVATTTGDWRVVDRRGVLLPPGVRTDGLPRLVTPVPPPTVPAGQVWTDDTVTRAVQLLPAYSPRRLERTANGWRLTQDDGTVLAVGP